jgi:TPR repeat protein
MDIASLKTAIAAGSADEMFQLGYRLYHGTQGATHNHEDAAELFASAAAAGHVDAMGALATCLVVGRGLRKDDVAGVKWAKQSVDGGSAFGSAAYGICRLHGLGGVIKEEKAAVVLLRKAADAGIPTAMNSLGYCYETGTGVQRDAKTAFQLYTRSGEAGHAMAMSNAGICYRNGIGVEKDAKAALLWFQRAAEAGYSYSMRMAGLCYREGQGGVEKDPGMAAFWFQRAAEAGETDAMIDLALVLETGDGTTKDLPSAFALFKRAADAGQPIGMFNSWRCYHEGIGTAKDAALGQVWLQKAAEAGNEDCKLELAKQRRPWPRVPSADRAVCMSIVFFVWCMVGDVGWLNIVHFSQNF